MNLLFLFIIAAIFSFLNTMFYLFINLQNKLLLSAGNVSCTTLVHFRISDSVIDPVVCLRIVGALILIIYIWLDIAASSLPG